MICEDFSERNSSSGNEIQRRFVLAKNFEQLLAAWREQVHDVTSHNTSAGDPIEVLYSSTDQEEVGVPGAFPYLRGIYPSMYLNRTWTMRQYAGFSSARETNERFRFLLDQGQTGLSCAFDLPTQIGYDADHELAEGEVGKVGVSICCLDDMEALLADIPLDRVSTSMTINSTAIILLAMYVAVGARRGVSPEALSGTIQNDILKEYAARGTYRFPVKPSIRLITDIFAWCSEHAPRFNTISISGYHMREAGCDAVQEVAFTLANGIAYVEAAKDAGLAVDTFGRRLSFFFNAHNGVFEEAAKFRAARRLWATIMKDRFGATEPKAQMLRFHTQTAGSTLTSQQSENNVVRVTMQALSAVLGGTQSLHTNGRDEALNLPTAESASLALRTQQIIAHESGAVDTIDPLGGSYFVEALTDDIESRASELIARIDEMGGAVAAIEQGFMQREIHRSALIHQRAIESGDRIVVGVNKFTQDEAAAPPSFRVDESIRQRRIEGLAAVRGRRDAASTESLLAELRLGAKGTENLFPLVLRCVEGDVTLGEICEVLEGVFGTYSEVRSF